MTLHGGLSSYGPLWDTLDIRSRSILGTQSRVYGLGFGFAAIVSYCASIDD